MEEYEETQAEYQLTLRLERALLLSSKHKHHVEHKIQNTMHTQVPKQG